MTNHLLCGVDVLVTHQLLSVHTDTPRPHPEAEKCNLATFTLCEYCYAQLTRQWDVCGVREPLHNNDTHTYSHFRVSSYNCALRIAITHVILVLE